MSDVTAMIATAFKNVALVADPTENRRAAAEIAKVVSAWQVCTVIPTSAAAETLRGAISEELATQFETGLAAVGPVALYDINSASGTEFARAASEARTQGATSVYGVALYQLGGSGPTAHECGLDDLHVVRPGGFSCHPSDETTQDVTTSGLIG